jgi:RNA polymerase sigma-70 factor (ECF subfamily)
VEIVPEADLVPAARGGDMAAFAELVGRCTPQMNRLARSMVGEASADDVVQESVLAAWRALPGFRGDARFSTWMQTICRRQALRAAEQARSRRPPLGTVARAEREWADPDWTVDPAEVVERAGRHREVLAALDQLPASYRSALILHDVEGLSGREVAEMTEVPLGTAKARIRRARLALVSVLASRSPQPVTEEVLP